MFLTSMRIFIINTGGATAQEVERLIKRVSQMVLEKQSVQLQREVHIVGEVE